MKLDAGQWITPAPWPTHNNPISSAAMPATNASNFMAVGMSPFFDLGNGWEANAVPDAIANLGQRGTRPRRCDKH